MLEILKAAFEKPRALTQNKNHHLVNKGNIPKYYWDFYPIGNEYYHEFNPYLVHLIYDERIIPEFPVFTVRDGVYTFAEFILKNLKTIPTWKTLFLIPENYVPLVPETLREHFLSFSITQNKAPDIRRAKSVTIFTLLCNQYFTDYDKICEKLSTLKDLPTDATINICLAPRKNPLDMVDKEHLHYVHIHELILRHLGDRKIRWLKLRDLLEQSVYQDSYLVDLLDGNTLTCDSYYHYWFLSRGGMVQSVPHGDEKSPLFTIDLSFHHKLQVKKLSDKPSQIADLIFFSKMFKGDYTFSPRFQEEVRRAIAF